MKTNFLSKPLIVFFLAILSAFTSYASEVVNTIESSSKSELSNLLNENKGKVIYLDFWASWCIPCRKSFPWMNKIQNHYSTDGFTVISVNVDTDNMLAEQFLLKNKSNFPVIYDPKGTLAKEFKLKGMPSSFIINRSGEIIKAHTGFFSDKKLSYEKELETLIYEQNNKVIDNEKEK